MITSYYYLERRKLVEVRRYKTFIDSSLSYVRVRYILITGIMLQCIYFPDILISYDHYWLVQKTARCFEALQSAISGSLHVLPDICVTFHARVNNRHYLLPSTGGPQISRECLKHRAVSCTVIKFEKCFRLMPNHYCIVCSQVAAHRLRMTLGRHVSPTSIMHGFWRIVPIFGHLPAESCMH